MHSDVIRSRRPEDLPTCVELLQLVHARDHYPVRWPGDPAAWLAREGEVGAWVAERDGVVVGHAVLRPAAGTDAADPGADATGSPVDRIALLARLFVAPDARRGGLAGKLIEVVLAEARRRDLVLALDVVGGHNGAIALYERLGWRRVATIDASWMPVVDAQGTPLHCYVAPDAS